MRVHLLFPPQWTTAQPSYGLAAVNGHLRRAGHEVLIRDLNLELFERLLSPEALEAAHARAASLARPLRARVEAELSLGVTSEAAGRRVARLHAVERVLGRGAKGARAAGERARAAAAALRSAADYYDPQRFVDAHAAIDDALEVVSGPFAPSALERAGFFAPGYPLNLEPLLAFARSREDNPCLDFIEEAVPSILAAGAGLLAISVGSFSQVHPALTLAAHLREALRREAARRGVKAPHLSLGGNFFSRLRERLQAMPDFFRAFADSVVVGEGEAPAVELAAALAEGRPLDGVPALLWLEGDRVRWNGEGTAPKMEGAAHQSLEGFPLERYLSPERVVCLRASKGCYWGQCTFCDSHHGLQRDEMGVERLVAEIRELQAAHGVKHLEFVDQCISPAYLRAMSQAFIEAGLDVRWFCNARTEPGFTPELFALMRRAGATMVMWGVESGSARLLKLMRKGVSPQGRLRILEDASAAGLFNFAYVFFGFPTETELEAESTIRMLRDHTGVIHGYGRSVFSLGKHAPLMADPERYGILGSVEDDEQLSTNLSFQVASGLQGAELDRVAQRCTAACREAYGEPLWMALGSREALHLYLARHGRAFVQGARFGERAGDEPEAQFVF